MRRRFPAPAPDRLWVGGRCQFNRLRASGALIAEGFVPVALAIVLGRDGGRGSLVDAHARRIVGWRVGRSAAAGFAGADLRFVLDALEPIHRRRPAKGAGPVAQSDRGSRHLAIRHTERLAEAGLAPSVGPLGDSCDNALAGAVIGLFETEAIRRRGPWRGLEAVELATLEWVHWFNHRRLLKPIGHVPPAKAEKRRREPLEETAIAVSYGFPADRFGATRAGHRWKPA